MNDHLMPAGAATGWILLELLAVGAGAPLTVDHRLPLFAWLLFCAALAGYRPRRRRRRKP